MVRVKPFAAVRPPKNIVTEVAAPPYDVLNSAEAKAMAGEKSLLHITKPEIDFDPIADEITLEAVPRPIEKKPGVKANTVYQRLLTALDRLTAVIRSSEGRTNKDLARLTDQITELTNKFEK